MNKENVAQIENKQYLKVIDSTLLIILLLVGGYFAYTYKENALREEKTSKISITEEEKQFKEEYESLNGTLRSTGIPNKTISIMEDNKVKYITSKEAVEIIKEGEGVIYFGFAACPWCRNAVPLLLEAAFENGLERLYYVNVRPEDKVEKDIRDSYKLDANNKLQKEREGDSSYQDLLKALDPVLNEYELTGKNGKPVLVGEKRLSAPLVITCKNGTIINSHTGTLEEHKREVNGSLRDLTTEEEKQILEIYSSMLAIYLKDSCTLDEVC